MTEVAFLSYVPDPFGVMPPALLLRQGDAERVISPDELSASRSAIVTYDLVSLTDELRRSAHPPPSELIGLEDALRLAAGIPRDEGGERLWDPLRRLAPFFPDPATHREFAATFRSQSARPTPERLIQLLTYCAAALERLWRSTRGELTSRGEADRYDTVEVPVQRICTLRQFAGVTLNRHKLATLLQVADSEKYSAYARVSEALKKNATGLNFWNIGEFLERTNAADMVGVDAARLRDAFRIAESRSTFAADFLSFVEASADQATLRRAMGGAPRLFPTFNCMGTVSGRILVSDPALQQLRRRYRGVIAADDDLSLVYLDFAQFEPGILAYLSRDENLKLDYSVGDLYTQLSLAVFADASRRPLAKRMFLAFMYGMSEARIAQLAGGESHGTAIESAVTSFFSRYPGLKAYRAQVSEELLRTGRVSSLFGNARYRTETGSLNPKEVRWAVNQPIQASASLIFKTALISLAGAFGARSIVLPVHDAVLLQFPSSDLAECTRESVEMMTRAFARWCPGIHSRVIVSSFAD